MEKMNTEDLDFIKPYITEKNLSEFAKILLNTFISSLKCQEKEKANELALLDLQTRGYLTNLGFGFEFSVGRGVLKKEAVLIHHINTEEGFHQQIDLRGYREELREVSDKIPHESFIESIFKKLIFSRTQHWWTMKALEEKSKPKSRVDKKAWGEWVKDVDLEKIEDIELTSLPLSARTVNPFYYGADMKTLGEFLKTPKDLLAEFKNIGPVALEEIEEFLKFIKKDFKR